MIISLALTFQMYAACRPTPTVFMLFLSSCSSYYYFNNIPTVLGRHDRHTACYRAAILIFLRLRLSFKGLWSDFFMGLFVTLCRPSGRLAHSPLASSGISQFLNLMIYMSPFPTIRAVSKSSLVTLSPFLI